MSPHAHVPFNVLGSQPLLTSDDASPIARTVTIVDNLHGAPETTVFPVIPDAFTQLGPSICESPALTSLRSLVQYSTLSCKAEKRYEEWLETLASGHDSKSTPHTASHESDRVLAEKAYALLRLAQLRTNLQTRLSDVEQARTLLASIPQLPSVALILRQEAVKLDSLPPRPGLVSEGPNV